MCMRSIYLLLALGVMAFTAHKVAGDPLVCISEQQTVFVIDGNLLHYKGETSPGVRVQTVLGEYWEGFGLSIVIENGEFGMLLDEELLITEGVCIDQASNGI